MVLQVYQRFQEAANFHDKISQVIRFKVCAAIAFMQLSQNSEKNVLAVALSTVTAVHRQHLDMH